MSSPNLPPLPKVGPICYAAAQDVLFYKESPVVGRHIPGVFDVALWSTDQMRAYATAAVLVERERCARVCEAMMVSSKKPYTLIDAAAAIRNPPAVKEG